MKRWALFLAGPIAWLVHFLTIYLIASLAVVLRQGDALWPRALIGLVTMVVLAVLASLSPFVWKQEQFTRNIAAVGLTLGAIAIVWQALPALAL